MSSFPPQVGDKFVKRLTGSLSTREESMSLHRDVLLRDAVFFKLFFQLRQLFPVCFVIELKSAADLVGGASDEVKESCCLYCIILVHEARGGGVDVESLLKTFPLCSLITCKDIKLFCWLKFE